jgi:DNA-binding transcriptional regulator YdaS (Cro superfamily)
MSPEALAVAKLRALIAEQGSQQAAAKRLGVSGAYVNDLLHGRREFSDRMLKKLGLRRVVVES